MFLQECTVYNDHDEVVAEIKPADEDMVERVLAAEEEGHDGRSNWMWVRLSNGDLILGVYPQGQLYEECARYAP